METPRTCPSCHKPLPPDVPLGLCPECLIKSGFSTGTEPGSEGNKSFVPPAVSEIAGLFPQFEIIRLIGKGGMGAVYQARQTGLDRFVALKILPPHVADDAGFVERFNREARALARLSHPNIVAVYDFGKVAQAPPTMTVAAPEKTAEKSEAGKMPTPLCYLVMEFVDGMNLREVERAGRLTPEQALQIIPQICDALQFAHNEGIVHRDIKPENILLDKKGRVKITDFGIAKIIGIAPEKVGLTGVKDIVGTPHYMAPEQVERPNTVDHRADIYSLGVVFYELLTGELPIGKFANPSSKVRVDVRLDDVVLRALEKEPERRYQQVSQVKTAVESIAGTPPVYSSPKPPPVSVPVSLPQRSADPLAQPVQSRCSRTAIVGAFWAMFFVLLFLGLFSSVRVTYQQTGPAAFQIPWWMLLARFTVLPLGLAAPFGTTILGWIAVGQIRRSAGRLYGMALAVFDGLCFPLLLMDAIVGWGWWLVSQPIKIWILSGGDFRPLSPMARIFIENQTGLVILFTLITAALIDLFSVWMVWLAVKTPVANAPAAKAQMAPASGRGVWVGIAVAVAIVVVVGLVLVASVFVIGLPAPQAHRITLPASIQQNGPGSSQSQPSVAIEKPRAPAAPIQPRPEPQELSDTEMRDVLIDLESHSPALQQNAGMKLTHAKPGARREEVVTQLLAMLASQDWPTRRAAAEALGIWGTSDTVAPLIVAVDDSNISVRWAAMKSLAQMKDPRAAEPLAKHLATSEDIITTTSALQSLGASAEDAVIPLVQNKNPEVRYAACRILKQIGTGKSVSTLTTAASDPDGIMAMLAKDALHAIDGRQ